MKKIILLIALFALFSKSYGQSPSFQDKLYYSCKVWGYVKYYHSEVSNCKVNWDSVLAATYPLIVDAETTEDFNNALITMLEAAGPMSIATTEPPEDLDPKLRINLNHEWFDDPIISENLRTELNVIKDNFRPSSNCYAKDNTGSGYGWLAFPHDDPIIDDNLFENFPDESTRASILFRYWNIINYYNPYNDILDVPWDSTLYDFAEEMVVSEDYHSFYMAIKKISSRLCDAHVEGLTYSSETFIMADNFKPRLIIGSTENEYVILKSDYPEVSKGDVLLSIDGMDMKKWEDSLRPYISSGNPDVFKRDFVRRIVLGDSGTAMVVEVSDSLGKTQTLSAERKERYGDFFSDYYVNDSLINVKWKKWDCNVGYVNMGILDPGDVNIMYNDLYKTKAIIFDVRNYPNGTIYNIGTILFPDLTEFVRFTFPNMNYPGTFSWSGAQEIGRDNNPVSYKGNVIILCNANTQSHAEYTCMGLRAFPGAVVLGSLTAGADGNISRFYISQEFSVGYTSIGTYYPNGNPTQRIGIVPDIMMYPTSAGIRQGIDEILEKALEIAGCEPSDIEDYPGTQVDKIQIYPNPVNNLLTTHGINSECTITDLSGKEIWRGFVKDADEINIQELSAGVYYLNSTNGSKLFVKL
ncbi:MAG: S41 family peptidase [Candidatus Kapabacteria bacterium]|nr:S41 family peptidase [Candidatus Kapabacteria bacterium]